MKQHQDMLGAVKPRDTAVTNGGLVGKVTKVDDNEVELEIAQGVRVRVVKTMLERRPPARRQGGERLGPRMLNFPRWKVWGISLLCLVGVAARRAEPARRRTSAPSCPAWARAIHINLGLDLAGGSQLLLEAETADVARQRLEAMEELMRSEHAHAAARRSRRGLDQRRPAELPRPRSRPARRRARIGARRRLSPVGFGGQRDWDVGRRRQPHHHAPDPGRARSRRPTRRWTVARDVIDRRINALGTLEPTIIRQGANRILVQVPGLQDPEALKALIGRTARLEFKLVDISVPPEQIPAGPRPDRQPDPALCGRRAGRRASPCSRRAIITGDMIADAQQALRRRPTAGRSSRSASTATAATASPG